MNKIINIGKEGFVELELTDIKINELIDKLNKLKDSKGHIHFGLNNGELLIHHEEDELK